MKVKDFDFVRFKEYLAEKEEMTNNFMTGKSDKNVMLVEPTRADYTKCRTMQESLELQLDGLTKQMNFGGNHLLFLEPWFGVGVYANAYGAEYIWFDGGSPQTHYLAHTVEELEKLPKPDMEGSEVMNMILDAIDYFKEETYGLIPISLTDTQSPIDTATLICDTSTFFLSLYEEPELIHKFLQQITDLKIKFTKKQMEHLADTFIRPGHTMTSTRQLNGIAVSDDNIVMLSPEQYIEFAVKYNNILSEEFGGIAIHSCGNYEKQLGALMTTKGLYQIDGAFSKESLDPNPNTNYALFRDTMKNSGVTLHARLNREWPSVVPQLYDKDLRLILQVPVPTESQPKDYNRVLLDQILEKL